MQKKTKRQYVRYKNWSFGPHNKDNKQKSTTHWFTQLLQLKIINIEVTFHCSEVGDNHSRRTLVSW